MKNHKMMSWNEKRKQIDIEESDLVGLNILAVRQHTNLKNLIEKFLHTLAEEALYNEVNNRLASKASEQKTKGNH